MQRQNTLAGTVPPLLPALPIMQCVCIETFPVVPDCFPHAPSPFIVQQLNALKHRQFQNKDCVTIQDPHGELTHELQYPDNRWYRYYIGSKPGLCTKATPVQMTRKCSRLARNRRRQRFCPSRGELSYLAPLGSEKISAPYFKQCFFRGGGDYPPD